MKLSPEKMYAPRPASEIQTVRVGVGVIVEDDTNRILMERRSDNGMWGLPGGRIEAGETVEETAVREVQEETGLTVEITQLLGIYSNADERTVTFPDNVVQLVDIVLRARILSGELTQSSESEELRFFRLDELPGEVVPPARIPLKDFCEGRIGVIG